LKREMFMRTFLPLIFGTNFVTHISTLIQLNANLFLNRELTIKHILYLDQLLRQPISKLGCPFKPFGQKLYLMFYDFIIGW
jgi:hypothetical protein